MGLPQVSRGSLQKRKVQIMLVSERLVRHVMAAIGLLSLPLCLAADLNVANPDQFKSLTAQERTLLSKQGLVARLTDADQMSDIYEQAEDDSVPILVTTDPMFHAFHMLFDYALRTIEEQQLYPALQSLLGAMLRYESQLYDTIKDPKLHEALRANLAYLSVPLTFLDTRFKVPEAVGAAVREERAKIEAHAGFGRSALTGLEEDFSQYIPRGHYAINERRQRYFKAMTCVEQNLFPVTVRGDPDLAVRLTRQALLLANATYKARTDSGESADRLRERIQGLTSLLVGSAQDCSPEDYLRISHWADELEFAVSDDSIKRLIEEVESRPAPEIFSGLLWPGESRNLLKGMSLLGRSYIPDAAIMQQLVFDAAGTSSLRRALPMGLDLMAVLGSNRARELLVQKYHQDQFEGYLAKLDSLRHRYAGLSPLEWNNNTYWAWLYALKLNLDTVDARGPRSAVAAFVESPAYRDKTLVTSCGSWTELRHDVILLAQQPMTLTGIPPEPPENPSAYVEPKPEVFRQLARMALDLQEKLSNSGFKVEGIEDKLIVLRRLATGLADIARGELDGAEASPQGVRLCRSLGGELRSLADLPVQTDGSIWSSMSRTKDNKQAVVADVATDPTSELVLEEAVGNPCKLYAVTPHAGKRHIAVGACLSYYEFTKPMSKRMTDKQWQDLTPKPPMPGWTESFITK